MTDPVSVDIMGPLPETDEGSKYVPVAVDCFTRWVEVYGTPNQEATTVARKLVDEIFGSSRLHREGLNKNIMLCG